MTPKMVDLLEYIDAAIVRNGCSPSFQEMAGAMNLRSKGGVARLIDQLQRAGYISRSFNRVRSIRVIKLADGSLPVSREADAATLRAEAAASLQRSFARFGWIIGNDHTEQMLTDLAACGIALARYRHTPAKAA